MGTVLTAALVKYTFPYKWNWVESLLFGAMFSATDPVAVVAVLKEVSVSVDVAHASQHHTLAARACVSQGGRDQMLSEPGCASAPLPAVLSRSTHTCRPAYPNSSGPLWTWRRC